MISTLLERLTAWLNRQHGIFELDEPVVVRDGSAWLRIGPGEPPQWFRTWEEALNG